MHHAAAAAYHPAMLRKLRPWLPCIAMAAGVAVLAVVHALRPRTPPAVSTPATLAAAVPMPPGPSIAPERLPDYFENVLRSRGGYVALVPCAGRPGVYVLCDGEPESARATATVEVRPEESSPPLSAGPNDYRVGPYHVTGDPGLMARVREAFPSWGDEP